MQIVNAAQVSKHYQSTKVPNIPQTISIEWLFNSYAGNQTNGYEPTQRKWLVAIACNAQPVFAATKVAHSLQSEDRSAFLFDSYFSRQIIQIDSKYWSPTDALATWEPVFEMFDNW